MSGAAGTSERLGNTPGSYRVQVSSLPLHNHSGPSPDSGYLEHFTDPNVTKWVVAASLGSPDDPAVAQGALMASVEGQGSGVVD